MRRGRPRTEIGTYGAIKVREVAPDKFEARTRFRMRNGRMTQVARRGPSNAAAIRNLKKALKKLADEVSGKTINGDTLLGRVMDLWLADLREKVDLGKRAEKTYADYRDTIDNQLRPAMGELTCREAEDPGLCNEVLKDVRRNAAANKARGKNGEAAMSRARTVLSGVCGMAVLHKAMTINPVKLVEKIERDQEEVRALEPHERADFMTKFRAECQKRVTGEARKGKGVNRLGVRARSWLDLPDMAEAMLSTGLRPGELLALDSNDPDLDARVITAFHHMVRKPGIGMVRQPKRKGNRPGLLVPITERTLPMWRRRVLAAQPGGPLFSTWNGQWADPGGVAKRLREVCDAIGYDWVSARYFRHTSGTHLVDSGLSVHEAADALGNTPQVMEKHYRRKQRGGSAKVAAALETVLDG